MSYKVYAGVQTDVDTWETKVCIHDISDITDTKKLISPTLTREVGKAGSLEFTLPLGNVAHSTLQKLMTVVEVQQGDKQKDGKEIWRQIWQGRVMSHEQDFLMRQKIHCEGELAYLNDSGIAPYTAKNVSFSQFLEWIHDNHNAQVDAIRRLFPKSRGHPMIALYRRHQSRRWVTANILMMEITSPLGNCRPRDGKRRIFSMSKQRVAKASCLSWEIGEEHIANGRIISRIEATISACVCMQPM